MKVVFLPSALPLVDGKPLFSFSEYPVVVYKVLDK
jgi:hypothetical protein